MSDDDGPEIHWYCPCGSTRQVMSSEIAIRAEPVFVCQRCAQIVGPVYESEELIRHEHDGGSGGC